MQNRNTWNLLFRILFFALLNSFNVFIAIAGISYLQKDFSRGYLTGKERLFDDFWFPAGLYAHSLTAPVVLLLVSLLVLFRIEYGNKALHRFLGKTVLVLLFFAVVPSGWILSYFAMGGALGKLIFFSLASYMAYAAYRGYDHARKRELPQHRYRMLELLALLSSAVILRLLLTIFRLGFDFTGDTAYDTAAVLSWMPSVLLLKAIHSRTIKI